MSRERGNCDKVLNDKEKNKNEKFLTKWVKCEIRLQKKFWINKQELLNEERERWRQEANPAPF